MISASAVPSRYLACWCTPSERARALRTCQLAKSLLSEWDFDVGVIVLELINYRARYGAPAAGAQGAGHWLEDNQERGVMPPRHCGVGIEDLLQ